MASNKDTREIFVMADVNGLEQLLSHYDFQIRSDPGRNATEGDISGVVSAGICE